LINDKRVLAVIPLRGGSKGLPGKNIREVAGKPLFAWTWDEAKKSKYLDRIIVSTDDDEILDRVKQYGCDAPFKRPAELATDEAETIDVVIHALSIVERSYDYVVLLQATSPLRTVSDIDNCISLCEQRRATSVTSVCQVEKSPYWMYKVDETNKMAPLLTVEDRPTRRQDAEVLYQVNGAVYVNQVNQLLKDRRFVTDATFAYIMPASLSIDIDTELDLAMMQYLIDHPDLKKK